MRVHCIVTLLSYACFSICSYPMAPLQLANPMTDAPIVTEHNQAYGRHTRHAEIAAEDDEYVHMNSPEAPIQPQPSIGM